MTTENSFHPYEISNQSRSTLELQLKDKIRRRTVWLFRFMPSLPLIVGIVLFFVKKDPLYLFVFGGIAVLEHFIFSFIKAPVAVKMDSMGFTVRTVSLKGESETFYLWHDINYIRYRKVHTKDSNMLEYHAILNTGKKIRFLSFSNYNKKKVNIPAMNEVLQQVSNKEVREK